MEKFEIDKDVFDEVSMKKLGEMREKYHVAYDDLLTLYVTEYYRLKAENPEKFPGWWSTHARSVISRKLSNPIKIYYGNKDDKIVVRLNSKLKEDFLKECGSCGDNPSDILRKMIEGFVRHKNVWTS